MSVVNLHCRSHNSPCIYEHPTDPANIMHPFLLLISKIGTGAYIIPILRLFFGSDSSYKLQFTYNFFAILQTANQRISDYQP